MNSSKIIEKVKFLRKNNLTITEIMVKTGLSKSTIFGYIKDIPKSKFLQEKIRSNVIKAQNKVAIQRRGKSLKKISFFKPENWSPDMVNLVAHFMFDGSIKRTSCCYNNRSQFLVQKVISHMKSKLGVFDYKIYNNKITGVIRVAYNNVEISEFILKKSSELLGYIIHASKDKKVEFLRAFFDDEGSVCFRNKIRIIRGYQHSEKILKIVQQLLSDFKIKSTIDIKYFEIDIYKKENIIKFQKIINFSRGIFVNGNRSNSIWKKDLEKRKILKMAIKSYL